MFSVSVSVVLLVFFVSQVIGVNGTANSSNSTNSTTTATTPTNLTALTELPTTMSEPTTSSEKTCANLSVCIVQPAGSNVSYKFLFALKTLYVDSDKYTDVKVSEVHFTEKEGNLYRSASAKLCLVFKGGDDNFIEDVFKDKVETGILDTDLKVIKDSAEFEPLGVSFKDWKAKEGECEKICDGAGGPFSIIKECEPDKYSCDGHKEPTEKTEDCTKYCDSSTVAVTVSSVILMIGIFLSSSFQ